ncbi:MAG: hypothetical protein QXS78_03535, partial [Candidatus Micrarchaeaceae archaeon]
MTKEQIGSVSNVFIGRSVNIVVMLLSAPLAAGDVITFDGWQEGITHTVTKITQNHKNVKSATPWTASVAVDSQVMIGAKVYKLTKDAGPENVKEQGQVTQASQDLGFVVPLPSENTEEAKKQLNNVEFSRNIISQANLAGTRTEFLNYTPSYAKKIKTKSFGPVLLYALAVILLVSPIIILSLIYYNNSSKAIVIPADQIFGTLIFSFVSAGLIMLYVGFRIFSSEQKLSSILP